jgi:hypothetical protein
VQQRLVSYDNPQGDINNSELELAASVAQHDVLAQAFDVREATIHNSSDNVATVWWQPKGATSSSSPTARLQALHQRHYLYMPLFDYIGGEPMPWPTSVAAYGTYLTLNSLPILPATTHRVNPGCSATYASQCAAL